MVVAPALAHALESVGVLPTAMRGPFGCWLRGVLLVRVLYLLLRLTNGAPPAAGQFQLLQLGLLSLFSIDRIVARCVRLHTIVSVTVVTDLSFLLLAYVIETDTKLPRPIQGIVTVFDLTDASVQSAGGQGQRFVGMCFR